MGSAILDEQIPSISACDSAEKRMMSFFHDDSDAKKGEFTDNAFT